MKRGVALVAVAVVTAGCGKSLPEGAAAYIQPGCKEVFRDELQTYINCPGDIKTFRDTVAFPEAKKQGAKVDPKYVMIYRKGTYTIAATKGQYVVKKGEETDKEAEADTKLPGYALMILTYKKPK